MCVWVHEHCYQRVIFSKTIEGQGKWSSSRCHLVNCQRAKQPTSAYQSNKASLHYRTVQWNPKYIFLSQSSLLLSVTFCSVPAALCHCLCWWILKRNSQAKVNLDYFCSFESFLIQKGFFFLFRIYVTDKRILYSWIYCHSHAIASSNKFTCSHKRPVNPLKIYEHQFVEATMLLCHHEFCGQDGHCVPPNCHLCMW